MIPEASCLVALFPSWWPWLLTPLRREAPLPPYCNMPSLSTNEPPLSSSPQQQNKTILSNLPCRIGFCQVSSHAFQSHFVLYIAPSPFTALWSPVHETPRLCSLSAANLQNTSLGTMTTGIVANFLSNLPHSTCMSLPAHPPPSKLFFFRTFTWRQSPVLDCDIMPAYAWPPVLLHREGSLPTPCYQTLVRLR